MYPIGERKSRKLRPAARFDAAGPALSPAGGVRPVFIGYSLVVCRGAVRKFSQRGRAETRHRGPLQGIMTNKTGSQALRSESCVYAVLAAFDVHSAAWIAAKKGRGKPGDRGMGILPLCSTRVQSQG